MDLKDAIRTNFDTADFMLEAYVSDLTPEEMLKRPAADANHVAWQLGHLIASERQLVEAGVPGSMPDLPAGFAERHTSDMATSDKPADFLSKEEYLQIAKEVRAGTLAVLDKLGDADFDKPVTEKVPPFVKNVGGCFLIVGGHWTMHTGQWVVLRRMLGRPRQF